MLSINARELHDRLSAGEEMILIDVREPHEHNLFNIGGTLIPFSSLFENIALVPKETPVILYCQKGIRSQIIIQRLEEKFNYTNLINLEGGLEAWRKMYDL